MLHGETGEDGAIREVLELLGVPYVGSAPAACRRRLRQAGGQDRRSPGPGICTRRSRSPAARDLPRARRRRRDGRAGRPARPAADGQARARRLGAGLHGRPPRRGPARRRWSAPSPTATRRCVERFVEGVEVAVPVRRRPATARGPARRGDRARRRGLRLHRALHRRRHRVRGAGQALRPSSLAECGRVALAAHEVLGLRDLSRSDLIVDAEGTVWFLEVNVAPGLTETSMVPLVDPGRRGSTSAVVAEPGGRGHRRSSREAARLALDRQLPAVVDLGPARPRFKALGLHGSPSPGPTHPDRVVALVLASQPHLLRRLHLWPGSAPHPSKRLVRFMAKREIFDHQLSGPLMRSMHHIEVDRADGLTSYDEARWTTCARARWSGSSPRPPSRARS